MRLLHPRTIEIIANMEDKEFINATVTKKAILSHAWSEVFKFLATKQTHPKMFITYEYDLGKYLGYLREHGTKIGCNMNIECMYKWDELYYGFVVYSTGLNAEIEQYFDDNYLFSDAVSLYYKGVNIFKELYGNDWRKYVPIESLTEVSRIINKLQNNC